MDLGLPSGTLWLDRLVGAQSPSDGGLFYQWGDIVGHSLEDGYDFSSANYEAKGLNLITSDLDDAHDAARAFYGPIAKMPSRQQIEELLHNCDYSKIQTNLGVFTSKINGESITIHVGGQIEDQRLVAADRLFVWSPDIISVRYAYMMLGQNILELTQGTRFYGCNIMSVHS